MLELNIIQRLNNVISPFAYLIKNKKNIKLLSSQYYGLPKNLPENCRDIFERLEKVLNIKSCVFFPIADESKSELRAVVVYSSNTLLSSDQIPNIEDYINSVRDFIETNYNLPLSKAHFTGSLKIEPDNNFSGNSYTLAVWLAIFLMFFKKLDKSKLVATGVISIDEYKIREVNFIEEKITAIERELLEDNVKICFFYNGKINNKKYFFAENINEILSKLNLKIDYNVFSNYSIDDYLQIYNSLIEVKRKEEIYNLGKFLLFQYSEKLNSQPYLSDRFKILSQIAHYYNSKGEINKAKEYYNEISKIEYHKIIDPKSLADFLSRYINFYIDIFDLKKVKSIIDEFENFRIGLEYKFFNLYANYFELIRDYKQAEKFYLKSLEYSKEKDKPRTINYLIRIYLKQNNFYKINKELRKNIYDLDKLECLRDFDLIYRLYYILKFLYFTKEENQKLLEFIIKKVEGFLKNTREYPLVLSFLLLNKITEEKRYYEKFKEYYLMEANKPNTLSFLFEIFYYYFQNLPIKEYQEKLSKHPYSRLTNFKYFLSNINPKSSLEIFNSTIWF